MPDFISLASPAKINLSLRVLGKREDGYHEIETLMAPVTLADEIELRAAPKEPSGVIAFSCNDSTLPLDENNLCVKAAQAFQKATAINDAVTITLHKKIPHGAGLGGGSSDAAAILRCMNELFEDPLCFEELHQLATTLGSDVPFFLDPKPRWCRGRGELLGETIVLPNWKLLLIKPPFPIATVWAYERMGAGSAHLQGQGRKEKPIIFDSIEIVNDLETPVFGKYLQLPILKLWLNKRPEVAAAWMSGSGSTMVAALKKEISQEEIKKIKNLIVTEFGNSFWLQETTFA